MNTNDPFKHLIREARRYSPFGEVSDFGFETRLRANLSTAEPGVFDAIASLSWKFSIASLPVILAIGVFLAVQQQYDLLPQGVGNFVAQWSNYLPVEI